MSIPNKITVETDREFVRRILDISNVIAPEPDRIDGMEYAVLEALIWANKEIGSINSVAAESFVKEYIHKPELSRKLFTRYRKNLADKGWLVQDGGHYQLLQHFDSNYEGGMFNKNGVKQVADIHLMVTRL